MADRKRNIADEIRKAVASNNWNARPPAITIGSWWFHELLGINEVTDMRVSWCGDTEVKLSKAGWWEAVTLRECFDKYTAQPSAYSDKRVARHA